MSQITQEIANARRALAALAGAAPLLSGESEETARLLLSEFASAARALASAAEAQVKPAFRELLPRWLAAFHNHPEHLRAVWRSRKLGALPARKTEESETDYLRRALIHALDEHGKKETAALLKEAASLASAETSAADKTLVPNPEASAFLKQLGLLSRAEARELLRAQKPKFLRDVAALRRIPFSGEVDAAFIRRLHESAVRFARNTAL